eukprot:gnl/MRDRNA2_/MRDRNA2_151047_c0_seq1.p1 gnl/MRDRNA2_/MRDRNA2_151047_c0~~gnl/MRDRNA2_/MRDRNA2_151047_c0_seq1.p1  ORF type:complete len:220 (-),score=40.88 gnl/MRDRNA2_/MRDRNA2_151047_c0_seq1:43-702(-)
MRSIAVVILVSSVTWANAAKPAAQWSVFDELLDRALGVVPIQHADLENATVGKVGQLAISSRKIPRPSVHPHQSVLRPCSFRHPQCPPMLSRPRRSARNLITHAYLEITEENVEKVLEECRETLGVMFDNAENRKVGITGKVDFVELDGPVVVVRLRGRFWHKRETVLARVASFLQERIEDIADVEIEDPAQLEEKNNKYEEDDPLGLPGRPGPDGPPP